MRIIAMIAEGSTVSGRLLTFRVGHGRFAVLLDDVLGVQEPAEIGAVADRTVVFQGHPVTAVDVRELWWDSVGPAPASGPPAVIIVGSGGGSTAMVVDGIEGIVAGVEMRPLPALVAPFVRNMFRGVTLHADGGRLVVDPAAFPGATAGGGQRGPGKA
jgi:chemotaxis protein histidine kinase CheA